MTHAGTARLTRPISLLSLLVSFCISLHAAPKLTIENKTDTDLYGAIYYASSTDAWRPAELFTLDAKEITIAPLASWRFRATRLLCIATDEDQLAQKLTLADYHPAVTPFQVGMFTTRNLSIIETADGMAVRPTKDAEAEAVLHKAREDLFARSSHHNESAVVASGTALSAAESAFINKRRRTCHKALEKFLGHPISPPYTPSMSISVSGGGMRAAQSAIGALRGFDQIGLLHGFEYAIGVSGGTWGIFPWVTSLDSISAYAERLSGSLRFGLIAKPLKQSYGEFNQLRKENLLAGRHSNAIDLYGIMLSNLLIAPLVKDHRHFTLDTLASHLHPAQHPFPIGTAVTRRLTAGEHDWLEYSPFDLRLVTPDNGSFVLPVWAAGRTCSEGHSEKNGASLMLGYDLATWGSAFSVGIKDLIEKAPPIIRSLLPKFLVSALTESRWARSKWFSPYLANFTKDMPNSPYTHKTHLHMSDGGHELNLPLHPLLRKERQQDLLILLDNGRHERLGKETLASMEKELKQNYAGCTFDAALASSKAVSYFAPKDETAPGIVYIRLQMDSEFDGSFDPRTARFCSTTNFAYTKENSQKLMGLLTHTITKNSELLKQAVEEAYARKKKRTSVWQWAVKRFRWLW